ncbi:hypothetical protein [Amycolatopsis pigmentata]|uniref:Uncharacterized protein n=1 Tax=Amycolatopsis pigmentata TaxID=450801 RepID=A0ABW5G1A5_9PSEU
MAAATRLFDVVPLLETDFRVQLTFTVPHTTDTWHGLDDYVHGQGGLFLPWAQAIHHQWDLILTASHRHITELHGPLLILSHGAGVLMSRRYSRKAGTADRPTTGLDRELLTYRGRVVPEVIALAHGDELRALEELCPEALPKALVAGDICLDRMLASLPYRRHYRNALGLADGQALVTLSSTWSPESLFGRMPGLARKVMDEFPGHKVAFVLHPQAWAVHGARQIKSWLSDCLRNGLLLIPPEEGWRATMIASDWVLGDHGSTTTYAAAVGCPVTMATCPGANIRPGSLADIVRRHAPRLRGDQPLGPQMHRARSQANLRHLVSPAVSSRPGRTATILRSAMYHLLNLPAPACGITATSVPLPRPCKDL